MGCLSSTDGKNDFEANDEDFDDEEKEIKPTHKMSSDAEMGLPEQMNVNRLQSQPLKSNSNAQNIPQSKNNSSIQGSNNRRGGQVNTNQASVLNNFNQNAPKNYDINQYNNPSSPASDQASTASKDSSLNGIAEHRMMDSHGNVHVNKFYNVTRNHNLSNASKYTDMSEMPSVAQMQTGPHNNPTSNDNLSIAGMQHMQNLAVVNNGVSPVHKMSIDSATTNGSKMLWDDFSERGSIMTENTSTV